MKKHKRLNRGIWVLVLIIGCAFTHINTNAQCFQVYDGFGTAQNMPYFYGCSGNDFTIYLQPTQSIGAYTISWGDGTANTSGASLVAPNYATHIYSATVDTFLVTLTETGTGCTITGVVVLEEPVNASIQIPLGGVTVVCAPSPINFINSSTNVSPTTTFTWDFGDGTAPQTYGPGNAGQTVTHTYQKYTVDCETQVTLTAENSCSFGNPTIANFSPLMVYDVDTAIVSASADLLCFPNTTVTFTNNTDKNCLPEGNVQQRYEYWNLGDHWGLGYDSIINWLPFDPPARPGHTITFPGVGSYTVMMIDSNMCGQDTAYKTITIVNPPTASFVANKDSACVGETVKFTNTTGNGAYSYRINWGTGWKNININKNVKFNSPGWYTVRMVARINGTATACTDTTSLQVYIKPSPVASFSLDQDEACDSLQVNISDSTSGAVAWSWNLGNGNTSNIANPPTQNYNAPGTYTIALTVTHANGCTNIQNADVTIHQSPIAAFTATSVCQLADAAFSDNSFSPPVNGINSWNWDFGDGNSATTASPTNVYTAIGTYPVTLIVSTPFCADTLTDSVLVEQKPQAIITSGPISGCSPLIAAPMNASIGASSYHWTFGNGYTDTAFIPTTTYFNGTTSDVNYTMTLIASTAFGCSDTATLPVTVFGGPSVDFTENSILDCGPVEVDFTNHSNGAVTYQWNFGDSTPISTLPNPTHIFNNTSLFISHYQVSLIGTNSQGCTDTITYPVTVYPEPVFPFNTIPDSGCSPLNVTFPTLVGAINYQWDFGDSTLATGPTPTHQFVNNTTNNQVFNVQLIATSSFGCADTTYEDVVVYPEPTAAITAIDTVGCGPLDVTLINASLNADSFSWSFGDGQFSTTDTAQFMHSYANTSQVDVTYTSTLVASSQYGCADTAYQNVTVRGAVLAQATFPTQNCTPFQVAFQNTSVNANSYQWQFGNGSSSGAVSPTFTFTNNTLTDTTYLVQMTATSVHGCTDSIVDSITVFHRAQAQLTVQNLAGCTPLVNQISQNAIGYDSLWLGFGDGVGVVNPIQQNVHTYLNTGASPDTNTAELIASTIYGCNDTAQANVIVYPSVQADFVNDSIGCSPFTVAFGNTSSGAQSYQWSFGNGNSANGLNVSQTFIAVAQSDTFTVNMLATSMYGCEDSATAQVITHHSAEANFVPNTTASCTPVQLGITNNSQYYSALDWDFDNGATSNSVLPNLTTTLTTSLTVPDTHQVSLIAHTIHGCNDTMIVPIAVYPPIEADFTNDTVGCSPFTVAFSNASSGAQSYQWNLGNGVNANAVNPSTTYMAIGQPDSFMVDLMATSIYGCTDSTQGQVVVNHSAIAATNMNVQSGCTPLNVQFANNSQYFDALFWDFGDGNTSTGAASSLPHTFINPSAIPITYTITLMASTVEGCNDTTTLPVIVNPAVTADFMSDTAGCSPLNVQFLNSSTGAAIYNWNLGTSSSSLTNPSNQYTTQGQNATFTVSLEATSIHGCADTLIKTITVYPSAVASIGVNSTTACTPATLQFTNSSFDYNTLLWDFDNGATSGSTQPSLSQLFVNNTGTPNFHDVTLYASTSYGCNDTAVIRVEIYPEVEAEASFDTAGCSPFYVQFQNGSSGGSSYSWNLGNGTMSPQVSPDQTYTNNTNGVVTYPITLTTTSAFGCTDITGGNIYVHPQPIATFIANPTVQTFPLTVVNFQNTTQQSGLSYLWDFDNGSTSSLAQPGSVDLVSIGNYYVQLIASNPHCSDTNTQLIQIIPPPPVAGFTGGGSGCAPLTVDFTNLSDYGTDYTWEFGDGNSVTSKDVVYTYFQPGVYSVTLTVANNTGTDTYVISNAVTVHPNAVASFDYNPYTVSTSGSQTFFYNQSANANLFEWNFGDGSFSTEENPIYQYTSVGDFPITLIANNEYNCPDTITHPTYIRVEATGKVDFPNAFIPSPNGPGDGSYSPNTLDNTVFHPITVGVNEYHLMIFNRWGEMVFESFDTQKGWDGYYRNKLSPQDVYVWKAKVKLVNGEDKVYTGDVTLLR